MSIRIRTVNGVRVALCAAETDPEPGDGPMARRVTKLTGDARLLLDRLIHHEHTEVDPWWGSMPKVRRNRAIHSLLDLGLAETSSQGIRATKRGWASNRLARGKGLVDGHARERPKKVGWRTSYESLLGELIHLCDNCGAECRRYQAQCRRCGNQLTDIIERLVGPSLDLVAIKHHGVIPPDDGGGWEP